MTGDATATYHRLEPRLQAAIPAEADYATVRFSESRSESLVVRGGVVRPPSTGVDAGVMITVWAAGGIGYAATSDLTESGLADAGPRRP